MTTSALKFLNGKPLPEIIRFDVQLDRPKQTFFSGDVVSGEVRIQLKEYLTVRGIIVRFVGEAYVNVPPEDQVVPTWDIRRIANLRNAFRRNRVRPTVVNDNKLQKSASISGGGIEEIKSNNSKSLFSTPRREENKNGSVNKDEKPAKATITSTTNNKKKKPPNPNSAFRSSEKYFEHKIFVFGHKYSSSKENLWPGYHSFPFQYTLPTKLPTSFHGRFGYVRYFCEASLERAWQPSVRRRAYFSVSAVVDVNLDPKNESSSGGQKSSNQCFFCCKTGTILVEASIKRKGYVPGETIFVSAEITNMSNDAVSSTSARLFQVVTYHSSKGFRHRVDLILVAEATRPGLPCGESDTWECVPVIVPPLPATYQTKENCKVLDLDYRVDFVVEVENNAVEPLIVSMPIVIGTVPLQRSFKELLAPDPLVTGSPLTRMTNMKYKGFPAVFSIPCMWGPRLAEHYYQREIPRKFEECVRAVVPGETFAPRYVCYRNREDGLPGGGDGNEIVPLTNEVPPPQRSRAASLQPPVSIKPQSAGTRNAHSSTQLALQPQPLYEPLQRSMAQLRKAQQSSQTLLLSPSKLSTFSQDLSPIKKKNSSPISPLLRSILDSPRRPPLTSSTSDQIWGISQHISEIEERVPATAPPTFNS